MSEDIWIWRAWGDVWQVGDSEDYFISLILRFFLVALLAALTVVVIVPVLVYQAVRSNREQAAVIDYARARGIDPARLGPCPNCGNEQQRDGRACVRCGY